MFLSALLRVPLPLILKNSFLRRRVLGKNANLLTGFTAWGLSIALNISCTKSDCDYSSLFQGIDMMNSGFVYFGFRENCFGMLVFQMAGPHPVFVLKVCQYGIFMMKPHPPLFPDYLLSDMTLNTPQCLECASFKYHLYMFRIAFFSSLFPFDICFSSVLESNSFQGYLCCLLLLLSVFLPQTLLQITVSLAQGYERTPSSPQPRFKSYAYTQAAYVSTSDPTRSPFPSQVCQHLLSVLQTKELLHPR